MRDKVYRSIYIGLMVYTYLFLLIVIYALFSVPLDSINKVLFGIPFITWLILVKIVELLSDNDKDLKLIKNDLEEVAKTSEAIEDLRILQQQESEIKNVLEILTSDIDSVENNIYNSGYCILVEELERIQYDIKTIISYLSK